jgi:hypothetical protein
MRTTFALLAVAGVSLLGCAPARPPARAARAPERTAPLPVRAPDPPSTASICRSGTLAACRERCEAGDAEGCKAFGARICQEGSVLECKTACDGDNGAACSSLASLYVDGRRVERNEARRLDLLSRACALGVLGDCEVAADRYYSVATNFGYPQPSAGYSTAKKRAVELYRAACEGRLAPLRALTGKDEADYEAAHVGAHSICRKAWVDPAAMGGCEWFDGTACDMLAEVDPSSHGTLAASCEANEWMACHALVGHGGPRAGREHVLALRKLCEHATEIGDHGADFCGRLKDAGLGDEARR